MDRLSSQRFGCRPLAFASVRESDYRIGLPSPARNAARDDEPQADGGPERMAAASQERHPRCDRRRLCRKLEIGGSKHREEPLNRDAMYGRHEDEWQQLEDTGWEFLKQKAAERPGDAAHDPTVSYGEANAELGGQDGPAEV
jgi:hypothetical protein